MPGTEPGPPGARSEARLPFVEGLRGLAALYVLLHHAALAVPPAGLSGAGLAVRFGFRHGHFAVAVFIVLSGYCLMRPVVADGSGRLRGGFWAYLGRRTRRIVPPYYAALGLSGLLIACVPALGHPPRTWWDRALPASGWGNVASHLLLVHNLSGRWLFKIDPPSWSVATEWQIYLLFPAFLALWRRWGIGAAVAAGFAVGYGAACLAGPLGNPALRQCCPWYAGLFTLGMAAAAASRPGRRARAARRRDFCPLTTALAVAAVLLAAGAVNGHDDRQFLVADPLVGAATALVIVRCSRLATAGNVPAPVRAGFFHGSHSPLLRLLQARWAVGLGTVSYSLYLVHYPLLALADAVLRSWEWGLDARLAAHLLLASPCCVVAAYLFHRAFERPFLTPSARGVQVGAPAFARWQSGVGARPTRARHARR